MPKVLTITAESSSSLLRRQASLERGCEALGYQVESLKSPPRIRKIPDDVAFAVCSGMKTNTDMARKLCAQHGIPVMLVELGFLKRADNNGDINGYFQLGWNRLCDIPTSADDRRWNALNLEIREKPVQEGEYLLVASQVGFDAQHNLSSPDLMRFLTKKAKEALRVVRKPMMWRPHPKQTYMRPDGWNLKMIQDPVRVSLDTALTKAAAVVTYNSTLGVDAMLRAIPVYCHDGAHYAQYARGTFAQRLDYMHRLAYAQWTLPELESGEAVSYMLTRFPHPVKRRV